MDDAKRKEYKLKNAYTVAIFLGICETINYEIKYGKEDRREELAYMVERYNREEVISGATLEEKLKQYNQLAEEKYEKKGSEEHGDNID